MQDDLEASRRGGLTGLLRSLVAGLPRSECAEALTVSTHPRPADSSIRIHNPNGRTRVVGEDRDDVCLRAMKQARAESREVGQRILDQIRIAAEEGEDGELDVDVRIPRRWNRRSNVHLEVLVPRDLQVTVTAANGKVCLKGIRAAVKARCSSGAIDIREVEGDVEVFTANAKISCACTCGRLVARSSNGKIELGEHSGSIDASTSNGAIHASVAELDSSGILLATSNGRIVLHLPEKVDADVDLRVENGEIRNQRLLASQTGESGRLRGRLGRGGAAIKLSTSNGTISLQ